MIDALRRPRVTLNALFVCALLCAGAAGQLPAGSPLPTELQSNWDPSSPPIDTFYLTAPVANNKDKILKAGISFSASEQGVWTSIVYREPLVSSNKKIERTWHSTSFVPTAVGRRAGVGRRFYVDGYLPRTGQVLVEEWRFEPFPPVIAQGQALPSGNLPEPILDFSYQLKKTLVYISRLHHPIIDINCLPSSNELMLLTSGGSARLIRVDLDSGDAAQAAEQTAVDGIDGYQSLHYRVVNDGTPSGSYAVMYLRPRFQWI